MMQITKSIEKIYLDLYQNIVLMMG